MFIAAAAASGGSAASATQPTQAPVDSSSAVGQVSDARTRDRVRELISEAGPLTALDISKRLGLTAAAVRRHLDTLCDQRAIRALPASAPGGGPRGRGRPARAFVLAEAGHRQLGSAYDDLATAALRYVAAGGGTEAVRDFARERMSVLEQRYAVHLEGVPTVRERAVALARALSADGFAASTRPVGEGTSRAGVQLCQGHCPVQHVAHEFPQLCDAEADAFSRLLGVHVQRLATLAHGEHVCTTFVPTPRDLSEPGGGAMAQPGSGHVAAQPPGRTTRASTPGPTSLGRQTSPERHHG